MRIIRRIIAAFSMYSRIPMPMVKWDEEDLGHAITFLPLIGAVIGVLSYFVFWIGIQSDLPGISVILALTVLPFIVTGGFHMEGFMDVSDALRSYRPKEKKIEIMKDPNVGAFAVINLAVFLLIWIGALYLLVDKSIAADDHILIWLYTSIFFYVRAFCSITCILFPGTKKEGMLELETKKAGVSDLIILTAFIIAAAVFAIWIKAIAGIVCTVILVLFCLWYRRMTEKELGGINGDTAGYFVVVGEEIMVVVLAFLSMIIL